MKGKMFDFERWIFNGKRGCGSNRVRRAGREKMRNRL